MLRTLQAERAVGRGAATLTVGALVLAAAACVATLVTEVGFPPPQPGVADAVGAEGRGWSAVTLSLALPWLAAALWTAVRGSLRGRLAWLGGLGYLVYTYLELAVSPPFTPLYLFYVGTFALALAALVCGLASTPLEWLEAPRAPRRTLIAFTSAFALLLALAWLKDIAVRTGAGRFGYPQGEAAVGHVVQALDLGLQVPLALATAVQLWRRRPAGVLLAALFCVMAACMGSALFAMVAVRERSLGAAAPFAVVALCGWAVSARFFASVPSGR